MGMIDQIPAIAKTHPILAPYLNALSPPSLESVGDKFHDKILRQAIAGRPASLVDIGHGNCAVIIDGKGAARLLNAGCPLDLDLAAFPVGMCARTLFTKAEIVLWRTAANTFRVELSRSFAPYMVGHLAVAIADID